MTNPLQRSLLLLIIITLFSVAVMAQVQDVHQVGPPAPSTQPIDPGRLDGLNYFNRFFGLSLSIPRTWVVASEQKREEINDQSKKVVSSSDPNKAAQVVESIERSKILLRITKLPEGQPSNAQFMLIAERVPAPTIKTGLDVIASMTETLKGTNFAVEVIKEPRMETVNTAQFGVVDIKVNSPFGGYRQKIYITVTKDYAIELFYTYLNDADLPAFAEIVKSMRFK
jgi:hypothetical protein